jgi:hypothetical protein
MAVATVTLDDIKNAIAWRESGLTIAAISDKLKMPVSTVKALLKRFNVSKGASRDELVKVARQKLIDDSQLKDLIAAQIAASVSNQLAMARLIEDEVSMMFEELSKNKRLSLAIRSRALSSLASSCQIAQSIAFSALDINARRGEVIQNELPDLVISSYSESEMEDIRTKASMNDVELAALDVGASNDGVIDEH